MALTTTVKAVTSPQGGGLEIDFEVAFDNNYPTGGETWDISSYFGSYYGIQISNDASGYVVQHDHGTAAAGKLLVYEAGADAAALDEVADTTDLSALATTHIKVKGVAA